MNVGGIVTENYYENIQKQSAFKSSQSQSFYSKINNAIASSQPMVLHGIYGSVDEETGDTVVGAWGDVRTGTSTTVYKPKDFDENNPVYKMKIWGPDGNVTEREVDLKEVNPARSDTFDMYAYSCYLSNSGKCPSALQNFMGTHAHYEGEEGFGADTYKDMFSKVNWFSVIKSLMQMQYQLGNQKGYLNYKGFYDFLSLG